MGDAIEAIGERYEAGKEVLGEKYEAAKKSVGDTVEDIKQRALYSDVVQEGGKRLEEAKEVVGRKAEEYKEDLAKRAEDIKMKASEAAKGAREVSLLSLLYMVRFVNLSLVCRVSVEQSKKRVRVSNNFLLRYEKMALIWYKYTYLFCEKMGELKQQAEEGMYELREDISNKAEDIQEVTSATFGEMGESVGETMEMIKARGYKVKEAAEGKSML